MKKILILIVALALYLHFFPQPELNAWYEAKKEEFLTELSQSTKVTFRTNLDGIYNDLKKEFISFSEKELANLKTITSSVDTLNEFYQENCQGPQPKRLLFQPDNNDRVCRKISEVIAKL